MDDRGGADDAERPQEIRSDPDKLAGAWANEVAVTWSEHEFTLDFFRLDYSTGRPPSLGVLVSRVAISPVLLERLRNALERTWAEYYEATIGKELGEEGMEDRPEG